MEQLLKDKTGDEYIQLNPTTIQNIAILGAYLTRFSEEAKTQYCILRSRNLRRRAILNKGIGNPDAIFRREEEKAMEVLLAASHDVDIYLAEFGMRFGLEHGAIPKLIDFLKTHQLDNFRGWKDELTNEELQGNIQKEKK